MLENILLRPGSGSGAPLLLNVELPQENLPDRILMRSPNMVDDRSRRELSQELLYDATRRANWEIINYEGGSRIVLTRNKKPLLVSEPLPSRQTAEAIIDHLIGFFLEMRATDPAQLENYLSIDIQKNENYKLDGDFYSLRLSIIAPDWPALFQEHDFRQLFQQVIAANIPAHLTVDYYWLTTPEMKCFEVSFKHWLEALRNGSPQGIGKHSQALMEQLQIIPPVDKQKTATQINESKMPDGLLRQLGRKFGFSYMFSEGDFSIFTGLSPQIASLFPDINANTWTQLATISPTELNAGLLNEGIKASPRQIRNWQRQANLARRGKWAELLTLQRQIMAGDDGEEPATKPVQTKVEKSLQALLRRPAELLKKIRSWVIRLPDDRSIPSALLDFLIEGTDYRLLMEEPDLTDFRGFTQAYADALGEMGISGWEELLKIDHKTWEQVTAGATNKQPPPPWEQVQQEIKLARVGDWIGLFKIQVNKDGSPGPAQLRANERRDELSAPTPPGGDRPIVRLIQEWRRSGKPFNPPADAADRLFPPLEYHDLLDPDDLSIFTGTGKKTETALRAAGIDGWRALAATDKETLAAILPKRPGTTTTDLAAALSDQAVMASERKWQELVRWQKGPMTGSETHPETPLETNVAKWITTHGRPGS